VNRVLICAGLTVVTLTTACTRPTHDQATLDSIKTEFLALMQTHPARTHHALPKGEWPHVIASLHPTFVSVDEQGVDVVMKPALDGGYGYYVPKNGRSVPRPPEMYSQLDEGIYWYRPH